ncbi:hypothetical protein Tco_0634134 [Tanacetum coccineum]
MLKIAAFYRKMLKIGAFVCLGIISSSTSPSIGKKLKIAAFGYNFERKVDEMKSELTKYMSYIANQQYDLMICSLDFEVWKKASSTKVVMQLTNAMYFFDSIDSYYMQFTVVTTTVNEAQLTLFSSYHVDNMSCSGSDIFLQRVSIGKYVKARLSRLEHWCCKAIEEVVYLWSLQAYTITPGLHVRVANLI